MVAVSVYAQPFGFLRWTVAEGLPQSEVTALDEDGLGYLWIGTNGGGIARFDGQRFRIFTTADGLPANFVESISADEKGNVFVITSRGVAMLPVDSLRFLGPATGDSTLELQQAAQVRNAGEDRAALREQLEQLTPAFPELLAVDKVGKNYLAGTRKGLYLIDATGTTINHYTAPKDLPGNQVNAFVKDRQGRYWIGTNGGLARMIPTGLRIYDREADGLPVRSLSALVVRGNGELWVGVDRRGLRTFAGETFRRPAIDDPTQGALVTSIAEDKIGRLYVATSGRGVVVIDPDSLRVERLMARSGLPDNRLLAVLPDTGGVWAISYDQGIGFIRQADSTFLVDRFGPAEGLPLAELTTAIKVPGGDLLLGTARGTVLRWRPDSLITTLGPENGLPPGKITAMGIRRATQLWVAISGQGLFYTDLRAEQPNFAGLPSRLGIVTTDIRQLLLPPGRSEVWIATTTGLERIYLDRNGHPDWHRHYGRAEGFPAAEPLVGAAAIAPATGELYFGTMAGLVSYTDDDGDGYLPPPPTRLAVINLFYAPLRPEDYVLHEGTPTFTATKNHLNFRFRAVDLTYPDRLQYQWWLKGAEAGWSPAAGETTVRYAGLSPGSYTFNVRATTDGGKTWGAPAIFRFRIKSPLWRQPWFLGVITLLIASLLIGGFYSVYLRVLQTEARKRKQLEAQNQLLTLEQKALRLQMNPHFIFNALNGIRGLVDGNHDAEARQQITRFATLMRGILNNSRQDRITLADELRTLADYLEMEQFCQAFPFTFRLEPPQAVDPEEVSMPSMLLQPFLENAVLHGLSGRETGGHVSVRFILRGRGMQCVVEDNGIGRAAAAARRAAGHKSVALEVTAQRLKAMKGRLEISDVTDDQGTVSGTRVDLFFPVETW